MCTVHLNKTGYGYTETLDSLVVALCRDFERRVSAIDKDAVSRRTVMEYRYINNLIFEGTAEIVGTRDALIYINEIGNKLGYAYSEIEDKSESTYKINKQEVKINIARKLHLID